MQIANPLFDTVFKYLLEDEPVARIFLSALIEREIVELTYNPQEMLRGADGETEKRPFYSVLRLDFSAKVRYEDGTLQTILIEVQKANNTSDLMRFRRYLGLQLQSRQNAVADADGLLHPIPIYPIYFLGEGLPDIRGHGAVKVSRTCYDIFTKEVITTKDNFVENLTHDALMVCANELRGEAQTNLEKLLSIFRLAAQFKLQHFLTVSEEEYPEQYRPVIRRLQKAAETASVRRLMDDEEDYYMEWVSIERKLDIAVAQVQSERVAKEAAEAQAQAERAAKEAAEAQAQAADAQAEALLRTLVRTGLDMGLNTAAIAQKFNLPLEAVERIVNFL